MLPVGLNDHDPRAVSSEQILVPLLRGHLDHGAVDRVLFAVREPLPDRAVDNDGEAAPGMVVPSETGIGGENDLADLGAADAPPPRRDGPLLNDSRTHDRHSLVGVRAQYMGRIRLNHWIQHLAHQSASPMTPLGVPRRQIVPHCVPNPATASGLVCPHPR